MVVEDQQRRSGFNEVGESAEQGAADVETDPTQEDRPVVSNASHPNTVGQGLHGPRRRAGWFDFRCRLLCLLRGDPAGQPLVGTFGVIDLIETVDLRLQLLEGAGQGLLVEEPEQGLLEAFVLTLRGRFIGFPRDRLHPERDDTGDELAQHPAVGRVQHGPVIAGEPLRNAVSGDPFGDGRDRARRRFTPGNMGGDCEAGVVVDELEDHTFATIGQNIFGPIRLPAGVRPGIHEPTI